MPKEWMKTRFLGMSSRVNGRARVGRKNQRPNLESLEDRQAPAIDFDPMVTLGTQWYPKGIAAGDVNSDGLQDLVVTQWDWMPTLYYRNLGEGKFDAPVSLPMGNKAFDVVLKDFDGDCDLDLATADAGSNTVSVRYNNNGNFGGPDDRLVFSIPGPGYPVSLDAGDINGDGKIDIVTTNYFGKSMTPIIWSKTNNSFEVKTTEYFGQDMIRVRTGNFNTDDASEMAAISSNGSLWILDYAHETFGTLSYQSSNGIYSHKLTVGDLNNDKKSDVITANYGNGGSSSSLSFFKGNGNGTLTFDSNIESGDYTYSVGFGDFDNDTKVDIATSNIVDNLIKIRPNFIENKNSVNNTNNNLLYPASGFYSFATGVNPDDMAIADFDGNGILDIAFTNGGEDKTVGIILNRTPITQPVPSTGGPYSIHEGDSLALNGSVANAPSVVDADFSWDLNGDGDFSDAKGAKPTLPWSQLLALGISDGPSNFPVKVRVNLGQNNFVNSASTCLTINNSPPTLSGSGPILVVRNQPAEWNFQVSDPSPGDQNGKFDYKIDWNGDGTVDEQYTGQNLANFSHSYPAPGTYTVRVTAIDKDGGVSNEFTQTIVVSNYFVDGELFVGGTDLDDTLIVTHSTTAGLFSVSLNGVNLSISTPPLGIRFFGGTGTDSFIVDGNNLANQFSLDSGRVDLNGIPQRGFSVENWKINMLGAQDSLNVLGGSATVVGGSGIDEIISSVTDPVTWKVTGVNQGSLINGANTVSFSQVESLTGSNGNDSFEIYDGGRLSGKINGGGGQNQLSYIGFSSPVLVNLQTQTATSTAGFTQIQSFVGGSGLDTLIGQNQTWIWNLNGLNSGDVSGVSFGSFENLTGGTQVDQFLFQPESGLTGNLNGGGGADILDDSAFGAPVIFDLGTNKTTNVGGLTTSVSAVRFTPGLANKVIGPDTTTSWVLNGLGSGTVAGVSFTGAAEVAGGLGTNTLTGPNTNNLWAITGGSAGTVAGISFGGIDNLTGGNQADLFDFGPGALIEGTINGGTGVDTISYQNYGQAVQINLGTSVSPGLGKFLSISQFIGSSLGNDLIQGADNNNTWDLTGTNSGKVDGIGFDGVELLKGGILNDSFRLLGGLVANISGGEGLDTLVGSSSSTVWTVNQFGGGFAGAQPFDELENLTGGTGVDEFRILPGGEISGTINGVGTGNILNFSSFSTSVSVSLTSLVATGAQHFVNFQNVIGGSGADTFIGTQAASQLWVVNGFNSGKVGAIGFQDFESLGGGNGNDRFQFLPGGQISGLVTGDTGTDLLDYSGYGSSVFVNLCQGQATSTGGVVGIEDVQGGAGNDILIGNAGSNLIGGNGGDDILFGLGGDDNLQGGSGRDILVGGSGSDTLDGGLADDILVAGILSFVSEATGMVNSSALGAIRNEWSRTDLSAALRMANLFGTGSTGLNGSVFINSTTVQDDGAIDTLFGRGNSDWFVAGLTDLVQDQTVIDILTRI